jgi:hypothetical protein
MFVALLVSLKGVCAMVDGINNGAEESATAKRRKKATALRWRAATVGREECDAV